MAQRPFAMPKEPFATLKYPSAVLKQLIALTCTSPLGPECHRSTSACAPAAGAHLVFIQEALVP